MDKTLLRRQMLIRRRSLSLTEVEEWSSAICERLLSSINWNDVKTMHVYTSNTSWREVATTAVLERIQDKAPHVIITYGESSLNAQVPRGDFDVIIVPLVAFDSQRQRLGFGGGWYDRFLSEQPSAQKIGLAFELQRVSSIPVEPHDIRLDTIITEAAIY